MKNKREAYNDTKKEILNEMNFSDKKSRNYNFEYKRAIIEKK